jgi:hypothetical protein
MPDQRELAGPGSELTDKTYWIFANVSESDGENQN